MATLPRIRPAELLAPLLLFACISGGGAWLGRVTDESAEQSFERGIGHVGGLAAGLLEQRFALQERAIDFVASEHLRREFRDNQEYSGPGESATDYQRIAGSMSIWLPGFLAINWINVNGEIKLVSPRVGNQTSLGKNLNEHPLPDIRAAFKAAIGDVKLHDYKVHYSPLIDLEQGGKGFAAYRAVLDEEERLRGVLNASFRVDVLLADWLSEQAQSTEIWIAVLGPGGQTLFSHGEDVDRDVREHVEDISINVLNEHWTLRVGPTDEWLRSGLVKRGRTHLGVGVLLGALVGWLYFGLARKRAQKEEADLRLGLALEGARLGVWDLNVATGALFLNNRWLAMLGYRSDQIDFDLDFYRSLVHPDDLEGVTSALEDHMGGELEQYRIEYRLRAQSGAWVWVLDVGRVVERDHTGGPLRVVGTQTDLTDIRQAELELERSVERYRSIFEHSSVGLLEQDMSPVKQRMLELRNQGIEDLRAYFDSNPAAVMEFEGLPVTLDLNPAFLQLFRAKSISEYRENVGRMLGERARHAYTCELVELFQGANTCETDFQLTDLDGSQLLYTVRLTVAPGCQDDLSSVLVSMVDNTRLLREEETRRNQEARDRQAQKDESLALLAGGVAHDFNNLLVPIIGNIELALQRVPDDDAVVVNLQRAEQASQRAADLARQMLTYSGRGQIQNEVFDMNALVGEMSDLLSASLPGKVDLVTDLHDGQIGVEGDPTQMRQLVMNLVINGADAISGRTGRVVARTGVVVPSEHELEGAFLGQDLPGTECAFIEVVDSGDGVDEETRKRMFEPFFSTKSAGRGLGMSVVLGIVRGHGGALTVRSRIKQTDESGTTGTRIRAYLPLSDLKPTPAKGEDSLPPEHAFKSDSDLESAHILFVDDEVQVRSFAREALLRAGFEVTCAGDGQEALDIWNGADGSFDVIVLDATMPRLGGVEAMERIRKIAPREPIILASGYTQHGIATRAAELELVWFLPKPFGVSELTGLIREVLRVTRGSLA